MKPPKHPTTIQIHNQYGFYCDGFSHVDALAHILKKDKFECAKIWQEVISKNSQLFDDRKCLKFEFLIKSGHEDMLSKTLTESLANSSFTVKFRPPSVDRTDFLNFLQKTWEVGGAAILTVHVYRTEAKDQKSLGHVLTFFKREDAIIASDSNLPDEVVISIDNVVRLFDEPVKLWEHHYISLDKRFVLEAVISNSYRDK